ncbi:MAG TPA: peptidoglycan editing factor PgeF [Gammaproteobacteria bacterium]|nr:peptidoglycan editing factor PgeF [Gammaproteobacteria bacterium]
MNHVILPDWPAPAHVRAATTLRSGGVSEAPYHTFNLAENVNDDEQAVRINRNILKNMLSLPDEPIWLKQIHSQTVVLAETRARGREADASFTHQTGQVCVVTTADCLPVLVCNRRGTSVAAIHAGWRGLANGIIENTLQAMSLSPLDILVWLGPAIGPKVYELGAEVREAFVKNDAASESAFVPSHNKDRWLGNLYVLAKLRLQKQGISAIYGGEFCTYSEKERFFSYRRDGNQTGRMASLIWMT